jgi:hypothetical protein
MAGGLPGVTGVGCIGGDKPEGVAGAEADGIEEAGIGVAGAEQAFERLRDAGGDCGVCGVRLGHGHLGVAPTGGAADGMTFARHGGVPQPLDS